jgi:peptide/nickel transport system ATP-binding protein
MLVTHNLGVVAETADRVLVMYAGRIVEQGSTRDLFLDPWHPYSWGLHDSIPPLEGARPRRLRSIAGSPPSLLNLPPGCAFAPRCRYRFSRCSERPPLFGEGTHRAACFLTPENRTMLRANRGAPMRDAS